jgi:hypothetical protein
MKEMSLMIYKLTVIILEQNALPLAQPMGGHQHFEVGDPQVVMKFGHLLFQKQQRVKWKRV